MIRQFGVPEIDVLRRLESELLQQLREGNSAAAARMMSYCTVLRDRYGVSACRRLCDAGDLRHEMAAGVLARLLQRNAGYRGTALCRELVRECMEAMLHAPDTLSSGPSERTGLSFNRLRRDLQSLQLLLSEPVAVPSVRETKPVDLCRRLMLAIMRHELPRTMKLEDMPAAMARRALMQHWCAELTRTLHMHPWGQGREPSQYEYSIHTVLRLAVSAQQLAGFHAGLKASGTMLRCAGLLQMLATLMLRHRDAVHAQVLPLFLRMALAMQWLLQGEDNGMTEDAISGQEQQLRCICEQLESDFVNQHALIQFTLSAHVAEEQGRCLAAVRSLVDESSATHVSGESCTAACKLCLNHHALGQWHAYHLSDSLRAVLFFALQQHYRLTAPVRDLLRRATGLLSPGSASDTSAMNTVTTELVLLEGRLAMRLWKTAYNHSGKRITGTASGVCEALPETGGLPDQLALGLKHLPTADVCLAEGRLQDQAWVQSVMSELDLLATGARRLKVYRIAALASVLLLVYRHLVVTEDQSLGWAAGHGLLQRGHHRLKRMLDQAAAWQEVSAARALINQIYDWLEQTDPEAELLPAESRPGVGQCEPAVFQANVQAIAQSRRINHRIRAGLKACARGAGRGEDTAGELVLLLELLRSQDDVMKQWLGERSGQG